MEPDWQSGRGGCRVLGLSGELLLRLPGHVHMGARGVRCQEEFPPSPGWTRNGPVFEGRSVPAV